MTVSPTARHGVLAELAYPEDAAAVIAEPIGTVTRWSLSMVVKQTSPSNDPQALITAMPGYVKVRPGASNRVVTIGQPKKSNQVCLKMMMRMATMLLMMMV